MVQWLRLSASNAGGPGSILGQGTRSQVPQLRPSTENLKKKNRDFPGSPVIKTLPSNAVGVGSSLVRQLRSHMPPGQKTETGNRNNIVTNSIKTSKKETNALKMFLKNLENESTTLTSVNSSFIKVGSFECAICLWWGPALFDFSGLWFLYL